MNDRDESGYGDVGQIGEELPADFGLNPADHFMMEPFWRQKFMRFLAEGGQKPNLPNPATVAAELAAYSVRISPFFYAAPNQPITLASATTSPIQTITMAGDSYFVCDRIWFKSSALVANPPQTQIDFADNETAGRMNNFPLPLDLLCGWSAPGQETQERKLPRLKVYRPGNQIQYTLIDLGTGVAQTISIIFAGWKVYVGGR